MSDILEQIEIESLKALANLDAKEERGKCKWTEDDMEGSWATGCDEIFYFTADGPNENRFKFCPYCGGRLELVAWEEGADA